MIEAFAGSRNERVPLVLDTVANGTVINYQYEQSNSSIIKPEVDVEAGDFETGLNFTGHWMQDSLCLMDFFRTTVRDYEECIEEYDFVYAELPKGQSDFAYEGATTKGVLSMTPADESSLHGNLAY
mmetsp:Transcript_10042/g.15294  ORF Transcript_10042/g.15294 Transcript_10042/m.15294 type:complete len:126 (+) Transcript_10042:179-556(+)|eukprot:CAMPEP_0170496372 /NCGR_PEP_ID=MMETSP0208-20121228/21230_1 /TAXON_ID=197538 /ORGANISM="Strombidium inclinatum, Strain S3" /LENGTH=125 /DNA_ID=CAMNT_0010772893 /DNA_START=132 /DNA_END=509 /DNA_ORIENTATION=+